MDIEFHTASGKVPEELVSKISNEMLKLSHLNKEISRAEIVLKEDATFNAAENKIFEKRLTVYGDDLLSHSRTESFTRSANEAIKELRTGQAAG
jgi:hypothetical protein